MCSDCARRGGACCCRWGVAALSATAAGIAAEEDLAVRAQRGAERVRNLEACKVGFRLEGSGACAHIMHAYM